MQYIGFSELTKRYYLLPHKRGMAKIDITDDVMEIIASHTPDTEDAGKEAREFVMENYADCTEEYHGIVIRAYTEAKKKIDEGFKQFYQELKETIIVEYPNEQSK